MNCRTPIVTYSNKTTYTPTVFPEVFLQSEMKYDDLGQKDELDIKAFDDILCKHTWIKKTFRNFFREEIWRAENHPQVQIIKEPSCLRSKFTISCGESISGHIYIVRLDELYKHYCVIKNSTLFIYSISKSIELVDIILLENCILKSESKSGIYAIVLYHYTRSSIRITLGLKKEYKKNIWVDRIKQAGCIKKFKEYYIKEKVIGNGNFSEVYVATNKLDGVKYAVKVINKNNLEDYHRDMIRNEIAILKILDHEGIINFIESFHSLTNLYIVFNYIEGVELKELIRSSDFSEDKARKIVISLLETIKYLRTVGVIHRDLKFENFILTKNFETILLDFGLSVFSFQSEKLNRVCGTIYYCAPEVLCEKGYNFQIDMWSLGAILYAMISKKFPFYSPDKNKIKKMIANTEPDYCSDSWKKVSDLAKDFTQKLLRKNPEERLTPELAFNHPWIKNEIKLEEIG